MFFIFFLKLCHVHVRNVKEMALYSARRALPVGEAADRSAHSAGLRRLARWNVLMNIILPRIA